MNAKTASKTHWSVVVLIGSSLPILLILLGILHELVSAWVASLNPIRSGLVDVTVEHLVFLGGLYLALPCGLLNLIAVAQARSRGLVNKKIAAAASLLGVLSLLFGSIVLIFNYMISQFEF